MAILPVNSGEAPAFETRLGIRLPDSYRTCLSDPAWQARLAAPDIAMLHPQLTMTDFAALTETLRTLHPEFPRDGVVVFCGTDGQGGFNLQWGYLKFLRPDTRRPGHLDDLLFSWDLRARRQRRDCRVSRFLDGIAAVAAESPEPPRTDAGPVIERADPAWLEGWQPPDVVDSDWRPCFRYTVLGRYLSPCDLGQTPDAERAIRVTPGPHEVQLRLGRSHRDESPVVTAVRILRAGTAPDERRAVFALDVDLAAVAIFDRQPFFRAVRADDRESFADDMMRIKASPCLVHAGKSRVVVVPSGEGDGVYPVYELRQDGERVGLEIGFTGPPAG